MDAPRRRQEVAARRRRRAFAAAAAAITAVAFAGGAARAQEPEQQPQEQAPATTNALLSRLVARDLEPAKAAALVDELLGRGTKEAVLGCFDALRVRGGERRRAAESAIVRHLAAFEREAPRTVRKRQTRRALRRIGELRDEMLLLVRAGDLTKDVIVSMLDPRYAELSQLALVRPAEVLAGDRELAAADAAVRAAAVAASDWFALYLRAMHAADALPGGRTHVDRFAQLAEPPDVASALDAELEVRALATLPELGKRDRDALAANAALRGKVDAEELAGTFALNRIRIALGLSALAYDEKLGVACRDHSKDMRELGFFDHESPVPGKRSFGDRAARAGTSAHAENILFGDPTGEDAIRGWWYSPGHLANMLGDHSRTGLGRSETFWTQLFG